MSECLVALACPKTFPSVRLRVSLLSGLMSN
jgi:hypothetical protein